MAQEISTLQAKFEAQKLAFGPIYFQAVIALKELGIIDHIARYRKGISISKIAEDLSISKYGIEVLLEAAQSAGIVEYLEDGRILLTKIGFIIKSDEMTRVNINFVQDVCYDGAKSLVDCIKNGKPEGLKVFGEWKTVYEGLAHLPEKVKKSWLEFDHYYSDNSFPYAREIVFQEKPKYLFDVGGNTGKWAFACCEYDDAVKIKILDLPGQLAMAKKNAEEKGFLDRIDFHPIDLLDTNQKIPQGADVIWMSQFLDCFSSEEVLAILKNAHQAASENTSVYILEPFFDNQKFEAAQYSLTATSLYFTTIANGNSKMYSIAAMTKLAEEAGFVLAETFPLIGHSYHTILKLRKA